MASESTGICRNETSAVLDEGTAPRSKFVAAAAGKLGDETGAFIITHAGSV